MTIGCKLCGTANNRHLWAVFADHSCSLAGLGNGDDCACFQVVCSCTGRMRDCVCNIAVAVRIILTEAAAIVDIVFGSFCNFGHGANCLYRIFSGSSFTRKHDNAGTVIDCVCNVVGFCSGRTWMVHHAVQHLSCSDNILTTVINTADNHFLNNRNFFQRNLNTHVSAGNHDTVGYTQDFIDVVDTLCVFNFSNNLDAVTVVFLKQFTNLHNILCTAGKGSCDKVKTCFDTKFDIIAVFVA